jgi:hypothetical protein
VRINDTDGAYLKFTTPDALDRVTVAVAIPDTPAQTRIVECNGPTTSRARLRRLCAIAAASFRPEPPR